MKSLTDIQESFFSRTFPLEAISDWLIGLAAVTFLLLAFILYKAIKNRRLRYNPYGSITDLRTIRTIIRTAFDQRRPFEIQVHSDVGHRRPTLRCAPEYMGQNSLTLEVSGLKTLSDKWLGRNIAVFFRIQYGRDFTYYTFAATIDGIHQPRPGICHITIPVPTILENRQKRSFLRIAPPEEFFMGAALWFADALPPPHLKNEITKWARPNLLYVPQRMEQFSLLDLSAGGARVSIPNRVTKAFQLRFTTGEELLLMLDLFDPGQNKRLRFWMECRVQSVWLENTSRDTLLGIQFKNWARPKESLDQSNTDGGIEWLRLSSSQEVEPLGNWIMRRHLELFRESPLDL